jgi:hypothetical protein
MSNRAKVYDDPLSMFGGSNDSNSKVESSYVTPVESGASDIATINYDKVTFKTKTKKSTKVEETVVPEQPNVKKDTFAVQPVSYKSTFEDVGKNNLFGLPEVDYSSSNDGLFSTKSSSEKKKNGDDGLFISDLKISDTPSSTSVRIGSTENDLNFDDLSVGKILEREDELDFDMFGKSSVKQTTDGKQPSKITVATKDDMKIVSGDYLADLESVFTPSTLNPKKKTSGISNDIDFSAALSADINPDSLDIDAYISQEANDGEVSLFG